VSLWVSGGGRSLHLKAINKHSDPVDLSGEEAREIAEYLLRFANIVE
jgi:hypothetical protein